MFGKHFFLKGIQQGYDVNPWITVRFGTSENHRIPFMKLHVRCFHSIHKSICIKSTRAVVVVMAHFKIPTIKTKPRKAISIDGLSEFQWNEIEEKVEIGSGSFIGVTQKQAVPQAKKMDKFSCS